MNSVEEIRALYSEGKIMLNAKNIEKIQMYLRAEKVLKAAGFDPEEQYREYREKNAKFFNRKYIKKGITDFEEEFSDMNFNKN
jgi:hypothetical protein